MQYIVIVVPSTQLALHLKLLAAKGRLSTEYYINSMLIPEEKQTLYIAHIALSNTNSSSLVIGEKHFLQQGNALHSQCFLSQWHRDRGQFCRGWPL